MGEHEVWVRDINKLDELGRHHMMAIADDLLASRKRVDALNLNPAAFGENAMRFEMERVYEQVRQEFGRQLNAAYIGMRDSGAAVSKIAKNYRAIERRLSA
ncbi:hypothetical protein [Spirillospora sp. NPDC029432]|uniref:hypothetical protein n=1 Tax=Spirillospora sp. NPDC029432 TaxID=3154599 RepID=UPI00345595DF